MKHFLDVLFPDDGLADFKFFDNFQILFTGAAHSEVSWPFNVQAAKERAIDNRIRGTKVIPFKI